MPLREARLTVHVLAISAQVDHLSCRCKDKSSKQVWAWLLFLWDLHLEDGLFRVEVNQKEDLSVIDETQRSLELHVNFVSGGGEVTAFLGHCTSVHSVQVVFRGFLRVTLLRIFLSNASHFFPSFYFFLFFLYPPPPPPPPASLSLFTLSLLRPPPSRRFT